MHKIFFMACYSALLLVSCDVRKHDTIAKTDNITQQLEIKDPTTVQIIDSAYNFGKVAEGSIVEYNYRFKNTGNKPLVITSTPTSCGCTVSEKPEKPIQPGEASFIKVKFNSKGRVGKVDKTITVLSNAQPGFPELKLSGEVTEKIK